MSHLLDMYLLLVRGTVLDFWQNVLVYPILMISYLVMQYWQQSYASTPIVWPFTLNYGLCDMSVSQSFMCDLDRWLTGHDFPAWQRDQVSRSPEVEQLCGGQPLGAAHHWLRSARVQARVWPQHREPAQTGALRQYVTLAAQFSSITSNAIISLVFVSLRLNLT